MVRRTFLDLRLVGDLIVSDGEYVASRASGSRRRQALATSRQAIRPKQKPGANTPRRSRLRNLGSGAERQDSPDCGPRRSRSPLINAIATTPAVRSDDLAITAPSDPAAPKPVEACLCRSVILHANRQPRVRRRRHLPRRPLGRPSSQRLVGHGFVVCVEVAWAGARARVQRTAPPSWACRGSSTTCWQSD